MNRILILSETENDLAALILSHCAGAARYSPDDAQIPFHAFDACCVLAGDRPQPLTLPARHRIRIEEMRDCGKPVFCEFVSSIGCVYSDRPRQTDHHRFVYSDRYGTVAGLRHGDVLDGHRNGVLPYYFVPADAKPILTCHDYICAHDSVEMEDDTFRAGLWSLWMLDAATMISSFRLCNFHRARLAPRQSFRCIIEAVIAHLAGEMVSLTYPENICRHLPAAVRTAADTDAAVDRGLAWFSRAGMLCDNGASGVYEGFSHHISAQNGVQSFQPIIRADCSGEVGGAFLLRALRTGDENDRAVYRNTADFCFSQMQVKHGEHRGMLRWTEQAWETCYQDDVARAILPTLLCQCFGGGADHFADAADALSYLADTTGADGLRVMRTDCSLLTEEERCRLRGAGVGVPSAHYNAYYHAALLLAVRGGADARFGEIAVRGLESIMALYPETRRETSETEELCRLIFPLALLYEHTQSAAHRDMLYRVTADLARLRHSSGGYAEWDTGYRAACARNDRGECALLANNGDPVADLLYSNNWLPLGFSYAYYVTGDPMFHRLWEDHASFLLTCQLQSDDVRLDGAWTRAMDMNRMESYGVPHDVGWAPCCIETGWTVAEILMGLQFMHIAEQKHGTA